MAYTVEEFLKLDLSKLPPEGPRCACGAKGNRVTIDGPECDDCYFDGLSSVIDVFPIGAPGVKR